MTVFFVFWVNYPFKTICAGC